MTTHAIPKETAISCEVREAIARCLLIAAARGRTLRQVKNTLVTDNVLSHGGLDHNNRSVGDQWLQHPVSSTHHQSEENRGAEEGELLVGGSQFAGELHERA